MDPMAERDAQSLDAEFAPARGAWVHAVEIDGEAVLLDEEANRLHRLNHTAALLWACFDGHAPVRDLAAEICGELDLAYGTVLGDTLLQSIKDRAAKEPPASFLLICPQSDPARHDHPEAERRLRRALAALRGAGIDAHGQISHPDPYTAAMQAVHDERVDEIIVSTFPGEARSSWLRKDVITRLRDATGLPVEHVEVEGLSADAELARGSV